MLASYTGVIPYSIRKVGITVGHALTQREVQKAMAECEIIISMSLLKVEISRPWLHAELFHDHELDIPEVV